MTTEGTPQADVGHRGAPVAPHQTGTASTVRVAASSQTVVPGGGSRTPALEGAGDTGRKPSSSADPRSKSATSRKSRKKPVEKPKTISGLFEGIYLETAAGRKPNLARNLWDLHTTPNEAQQEIDLVRRLAVEDRLLDALSNTLIDVADIDLKEPVRRRILELVIVAFASHKLFEGTIERLVDPKAEPLLTAAEISHRAGSFDFDDLGAGETLEVTGAKRERLRVNAVIAFEVFRVVRDGWSKTQFITDFCELVWRVPNRFQGAQRIDPVTGEKGTQDQSQWRTVAMLASAKPATESLSELKRHFEALLRDREKKTSDALDEVAAQSRRAERESGMARSLRTELADKGTQLDSLRLRVAELERELAKEQSGRFADEMHAVNDYEVLRTQVIRLLSGQVNLLTDGLHALRNGSTAVADEFIDRVLGKIDAEVKRLKGLEGSAQ